MSWGSKAEIKDALQVHGDTQEIPAKREKRKRRSLKARARVRQVPVDLIRVKENRRACTPEELRVIAASMRDGRPAVPITVRVVKEVHDGVATQSYELVAGLIRLEAARLNGCTRVDAIIFRGTRKEALRWQLEENLVRAELTVLQRSIDIRRWVSLIEKDRPKFGQVDQKRPGRRRGGVAEAARRLPVPGASEEARRKSVERALNIAGIPPEVQSAVEAAGLGDNQSALLQIARETAPEAQLRKVRTLAAGSANATSIGDQSARVQDQTSRQEEMFRRLKKAWEAASEPARARFKAEVLCL